MIEFKIMSNDQNEYENKYIMFYFIVITNRSA